MPEPIDRLTTAAASAGTPITRFKPLSVVLLDIFKPY
jgi:hypothetical protein